MNLPKYSIKSSLRLLKFPCRFEFSIVLCFLRERLVLFEMRLHFTEPLSIKESRVSSNISLLIFSSIISFSNLNTSYLPHLLFCHSSVSIYAIISPSFSLPSMIFGISFVAQLIPIWKLLGFLTATNVIIWLLIR